MGLNEALDEVYRSWLRVQPHVAGKLDRDARHPEIVLGIARELDLLPPIGRTLKVTGSKGKGTTARFAADLIAQAQPHAHVGLFVSPHEVEQPDRIRRDGAVIPAGEFCRIVERLAPIVRAHEARLAPDQYISPVGYFLLIALDWYKRTGVDWFVLECGRGAAYDEVGRLPADVSVVTSVLNEHVDKLGPQLVDIARDKFSVIDTSRFVVAPKETASQWPPAAGRVIPPAPVPHNQLAPSWIAACRGLAQRAVELLLGLQEGALSDLPLRVSSASFGAGSMGGVSYIHEAAINPGSFDEAWLNVLRARSPQVLACLSDDKDRAGVLAILRTIGPVKEIALTGQFDYLHFAEAEAAGAIALDVNDAGGLYRLVAQNRGPVYLVGTQSFIRLVHRAQLLERA